MRWLVFTIVLAAPPSPQPQTIIEFNRLVYVEPKEVKTGAFLDSGIFWTGTKHLQARTRYGMYYRQDKSAFKFPTRKQLKRGEFPDEGIGTVIADGPGGKRHYFAFDLATGKRLDELPAEETLTIDRKPVRVPQGCIACHERDGKFSTLARPGNKYRMLYPDEKLSWAGK